MVAACVIASWTVCTVNAHRDVSDESPLMIAASDEHIWFVAASSGGEPLRLMHHASAMRGPYYTPGTVLAEAPESMAAWGDTVWLVVDHSVPTSPALRSLYSVRVERNPALGGYYFLPHARLALEPALPGDGELIAFAAGADGPVALLVPRSTGRSAAANVDVQGRGPRLLRLVNGRWDPLDLPMGAEVTAGCFLAYAGVEARMLTLLAPDPRDSASASLFIREPAGSWTATALSIDTRNVVGLTRYQGQVVAVLSPPHQRNLQLVVIRPDGAFELDRIERPGDPWDIGGTRDGLFAIDAGSHGELGWRRFDPITRHGTHREVMSHQPLGTTRLIHIPLLVATAVTALLLVFLFRPATPPGEIELPEKTVPGSANARLVALAIDLLPGAILAIAVTGASLLELLRLPVWTARLEDGAPALIVIAATMIHCTIAELCWRRSLGKWLTGLEVMSIKGGRASTTSILLRNLGKLVVLLVPPLAAVALLNRHMQGLDDMVGRTVVVAAVPESSDGAAGRGPGDR